MKPRPMRVTLPKEARRAPGTRGGKAWDRGTKPPQRAEIARRGPRQGPREQVNKENRGRGFDRPRSKQYAGKPGGFAGHREERGPRTEWKPRERTFGGASASGAGRSGERGGDRPRFDKRAGGPPRAGSGFDKRGGKPFGARPAFGGEPEGGASRSRERGGERKEWKPREQAAGGFESAPRKPFRPQGERPAFVRPEGSFKRSDGPKKRFDGGREAGAGKSFGRRTGSKERWVPRPNRPRTEEGRGQAGSAERPALPSGEKRWEGKGGAAGTGRTGAGRTGPAFGARPGGFKRPGKPGGFARPGGFSKPGRPSGGASRGGARFGGKRPEGR